MNKRARGALLAAAVIGGGMLGATGISGVALAQSDRGDDRPAVAVQTDDGDQAPDQDQAPSQDGQQDGAERDGRGPRRGCHLDAAAEAIGISVDELRSELEDGTTTIADVAQEHGVSTDDVVAAMVADLQEHVDQKVADGELSQDEADQKLADAQERITERVTTPHQRGERGERPERPADAGSQAESEDAS